MSIINMINNNNPNDVVKNQSVPTLSIIVDELTFLIDTILVQSDTVHNQRETCYCLRSIINELKKHMLGEYCSQKHIDEKLEKLAWYFRQYSIRDDIKKDE